MRSIIAYDISDNGRRARFAAALSEVGDRIQKSVFACEIDDDQQANILRKASELIDVETDRVHLVAQCPDCAARLGTVGQAREFSTPEYWIL